MSKNLYYGCYFVSQLGNCKLYVTIFKNLLDIKKSDACMKFKGNSMSKSKAIQVKDVER